MYISNSFSDKVMGRGSLEQSCVEVKMLDYASCLCRNCNNYRQKIPILFSELHYNLHLKVYWVEDPRIAKKNAKFERR